MRKLLLTFGLAALSALSFGAIVNIGVIGPGGGGGGTAELLDFGQSTELTGSSFGGHCVIFEAKDSQGNLVFTSDCTIGVNGEVTMEWTPPYVDVFTVTAQIEDANGLPLGDSSLVVTITVNPPTGSVGFITGGGHFDVPTGRSTFGFVAKVLGNGQVRGNLEYQDHGLGLNVKSSAVNFVFANPVTMEGFFSGTCKVNGATGYRFNAYVVDLGEPGLDDVFMVWVYDANNALVHASGATQLGRGNIQLHG